MTTIFFFCHLLADGIAINTTNTRKLGKTKDLNLLTDLDGDADADADATHLHILTMKHGSLKLRINLFISREFNTNNRQRDCRSSFQPSTTTMIEIQFWRGKNLACCFL